MTTAPWTAPDSTTQAPPAWGANVDGNMTIIKRSANNFAAHAQTSPNMTVRIEAGHLFDGTVLTEVAAQNTGTITAPSSHPRIDRVVIDRFSGAVSVITGSEASSPSAPAITAGQLPVAQVLLQTTSTSITSSMITEEREQASVGRRIGQIVSNIVTAESTGTTAIPFDDTIPQNTEGTQFLSATITPKNSSSKLRIDVNVTVATNSGNELIAALFQDSTANAIAAKPIFGATANQCYEISFSHLMDAGTTSATTFKVRIGTPSGDTITLNGASAARVLGGVLESTLIITELLP